jgi:hypothetical protein
MKTLQSLCILILIVAATGCSTVYDVQYDYDKKAVFTDLKTYDWMAAPQKTDIDSLTMSRIQKAVETELQAKGLSRSSSDPDFLIAEHIGREDKVSVRSWGYDYGPYGGYWGGYWGTGGVSTFEYEEGTLILDFVDPQTNKLIWRGSAKAEIDTVRTVEERETLINESVQKILKNFPPPAS